MASARGANWVDRIAIDRSAYPDTVFFDFIDHNANWWGSYPSYFDKSWDNRFGNPQGKAQLYYSAAVAALKRGDRIEASKCIGYVSHYLVDVNGPLHTQSSATETRAFHNGLEGDASNFDFSAYIADDGYQYRRNASDLTVGCANASHAYYADLISSYKSQGFSSHVKYIEGINLNRGVNALADLIQSAQDDADSVTAVIDSVSPSSSTSDQPVAFAGHGVDRNHPIAAWQWRSSINGPLSTASSFTTTTLSPGIHRVYFKAMCSTSKWSPEAWAPHLVGAQGTKPLPVYRFYNFRLGSHFYTASEAEKNDVLRKYSSTFSFEGIAYGLDASATANSDSLYRFYNVRNGSHFYTANPAERDNVKTDSTARSTPTKEPSTRSRAP